MARGAGPEGGGLVQGLTTILSPCVGVCGNASAALPRGRALWRSRHPRLAHPGRAELCRRHPHHYPSSACAAPRAAAEAAAAAAARRASGRRRATKSATRGQVRPRREGSGAEGMNGQRGGRESLFCHAAAAQQRGSETARQPRRGLPARRGSCQGHGGQERSGPPQPRARGAPARGSAAPAPRRASRAPRAARQSHRRRWSGCAGCLP